MESYSNSSVDALCKEGIFRNESTLSEEEAIEKYFVSTRDRYIITVFYPILLTFGLFGNLAFLAVVAKIPSMRTLTNAYLANLAICDTVYIISQGNDVLGDYLRYAPLDNKSHDTNLSCIMRTAGLYVSLFTSVCLLLTMTTERFLGICRPLQHRFIATKERTVKLIILCWIMGVLYSGLVVPRWGKVTIVCVLWPNTDRFSDLPSKLSFFCSPIHPFFAKVSLIAQACPFVIATIFNTIMFSRIIKKLHERISGDDAAGGFDQNAMKSRNNVARLLIVTNVVFFLCLSPYFFLCINISVLELSDYRIGISMPYSQLLTLFWFARGLTVLNATTNPVIYSLTNPRYRQAFLQLFGKSYKSTGQRKSRESTIGTASMSVSKM
ncbi:thyrotropin-releasing hormone receptor-like [Amphiura filiformis]|uniref:thyrotropin-releasing hormone receptor-like n=1 Tax=Amphiura filiformis TaxID=82378 RepID=UPI003B20F695